MRSVNSRIRARGSIVGASREADFRNLAAIPRVHAADPNQAAVTVRCR